MRGSRRNRRPRAVCFVCQRLIAITAHHRYAAHGRKTRCPGTGQSPNPIIRSMANIVKARYGEALAEETLAQVQFDRYLGVLSGAQWPLLTITGFTEKS